MTNIKDINLAQDELLKSLSLLQATLDSTADGILVVDNNGKMVSFNRKFVDMWRLPQWVADSKDDHAALEFVRNQLKDPDSFLKKVRELYMRLDEEAYDILEFKDGRIFERFSIPQRIGEKCVGRVWSFRDVTDRRRAEFALKKRTEEIIHYQTALLELAKIDNSDFKLALKTIIEVDSKTLNIDRVSVWFFNGDRSEICCEDLYTKSLNQHDKGTKLEAKQYPKYFQALDESRTISADDAQNDLRTCEFTEGYLIPLQITSMMDVPIRLRGKVLGIVCHEHIGAMRHWLPEEQQFVADIADMVSLALESSERKRAEEELKQANEDLQRLSQLKSQFALMVSHELRTPLTVIKEAIGIVSDGIDGPVTEGQKETLGMARDNVDRLARLINNVLDYERLESGKMKMVFEKTNINQLINDIHQFMQMVAKKKNIQLLLALPEAPLFATCDSDKLREVMINLIDNGLKFTPSGGKITIRLSQLNNQVKIEVEDTGMGIKKEEQDKIYEMFIQGSGHLALKIGGFGVGLAVCKLIVIQHQGEISVESMPGKGTTFHLLIPIEQT